MCILCNFLRIPIIKEGQFVKIELSAVNYYWNRIGTSRLSTCLVVLLLAWLPVSWWSLVTHYTRAQQLWHFVLSQSYFLSGKLCRILLLTLILQLLFLLQAVMSTSSEVWLVTLHTASLSGSWQQSHWELNGHLLKSVLLTSRQYTAIVAGSSHSILSTCTLVLLSQIRLKLRILKSSSM